MIKDYVPITRLQRKARDVFGSPIPFQMVMSNNAPVGLIISEWFVKHLISTGMLDDVIDNLEMAAMHDEETLQMVKDARSGKLSKDSISFEDYRKKHDV